MVFQLPRERPRVVVKADLLPAISILSLFGLLGIPLGWLWAQLAPPQRSQIQPDGKAYPIDIEAWHAFDAVVIFALLAAACGVVIGVGTWLLRERRGPVAMAAAVLGSLLAGWLGTTMGGAFLGDRYTPDGPPEVGQIIDVAPEITTDWVLICAPLTCAFTYALLAAWNGRDDLGRRLG
jgi:ABC-type Fe3+ transport system permease subunit